MADIIRLVLVLLLIILLLRRKIGVGAAMTVASLFLSVVYLFSFYQCFLTIKSVFTDSVSIKLLLSLSLIRSVELLLREKEVLSALMRDVTALIQHKKAVILSMPVLIGMLPSLGGAYFSAPMVEEAAKDTTMSQEEKAFVNYWFRHIWELILPLYPGLLLASAISKIDLGSLALYNVPIAAAMVISGFVFSMRGIKDSERTNRNIRLQHLTGVLSFIIPITLILMVVVFFEVELYIALGVSLLALFIAFRLSYQDIFRILRHGFHRDVFILIFGVMLFKNVFEYSGAVDSLSLYFNKEGFAVLPVLIILPFITGMLTGLTVAYVGGTFPLLISLLGGAPMHQVMLAFVSGYAGVLLSPVHLCMILTREYFRADMAGLYRKICRASILIVIAVSVWYMVVSNN